MNMSKEFLGGGIDENSPLYKTLFFKSQSADTKNPLESCVVTPKPGWCIKTRDKKNKKVFLNICTSELVLKPKDLPENEVRKIIESEDPTKFRIPMGIGELHKEKDKSGEGANHFRNFNNSLFL